VSLSADGRFVAFASDLVGLVPEDDHGAEDELGMVGTDVFLHDRLTGRTSLVSRSTAGENADAASSYPDISADGRYVAFASSASNLIDGQREPGHPWVREETMLQLFVHETATRKTELVSLSDSGQKANDKSFAPSISADGRYVAFSSVADNLIGDADTNEGMDVFVRDRWLRRTERVSVSSTGEQQYLGEFVERAGVNPAKPDLSGDGRYVVFMSPANNLVPGDSNGDDTANPDNPACRSGDDDIYLRDRVAGTTTRVSVSSSGEGANGSSSEPSISADGRRIAFDSVATNLVEPRVAEADPGPSCVHTGDSFVHIIPVLH
jgi:Tol biopolymer transport system component